MKLCTIFPVVLLSFVMVTLVLSGARPVPGGAGSVATVRYPLRVHTSTCQGSSCIGPNALLLRIVPGLSFGRTDAGSVCCMHRANRSVQGAQRC